MLFIFESCLIAGCDCEGSYMSKSTNISFLQFRIPENVPWKCSDLTLFLSLLSSLPLRLNFHSKGCILRTLSEAKCHFDYYKYICGKQE